VRIAGGDCGLHLVVFGGELLRNGWLGSGGCMEEAHLSSRAAFSLHVMFDKTDAEIEAERLEIERL
jgi:hypothetical protein